MIEYIKKYFFFIASILFFISLVIIDLFFEKGSNQILKTFGLVFLFSSPIFFIPPFIILKKYGKNDPKNSYMITTTLVNKGVYKIVRHPQYLGYIFLFIGFSLTTQNIFLILIGLITIAAFSFEANNEEKILLSKFGNSYKDYMNAVPKFNFLLGIIKYFKSRK